MADKHEACSQKDRINSLQALRAIAFIGIFVGHAHSPLHWAGLGVSVFFVLSGFLMEYNYFRKPLTSETMKHKNMLFGGVKNNIEFALKK